MNPSRRSTLLGFHTALPLIGLLAISGNLHAQPFGVYNARTAGMGGVGVATGARYASFNNPALLATASQENDWYLMLPTIGRRLGDPDELADNLDSFQQAADALDLSASPGDLENVQTRLDAMSDSQYREGGNTAIMLAIPGRFISAAAYVNVYDWANARATIGGDDLSDPANPQYASSIEHRGARVLENGITAAKSLNAVGWRRQLAVGFNVKFVFVEGYGYSEGIRDAQVRLSGSQYSSGANFNLDLGLIKEFGVWKVGLMAKNLFSDTFEYGTTGEYFKLSPQLRSGFAYHSRRTVFELDLDLIPNPANGLDTETQFAAVGMELKPWRWLALRTGFQQNLIGSQIGTASLGMGLTFGFLSIDLAATYDELQNGAFAELGYQF